MDNPADDREFKSHMSGLERLLKDVESIRDPAARDLTGRVIQSLMEFHGAAVGRIVEQLQQSVDTGPQSIEALAGDELVASLLLLYGLHPHDTETRVRRALQRVRPSLASHGGNVELLAITSEGIVRLRMQGNCHGCPSSSATLGNLIEAAVYDAAPEVTSVELENADETTTPAAAAAPSPSGFVPLEKLVIHRTAPAAAMT